MPLFEDKAVKNRTRDLEDAEKKKDAVKLEVQGSNDRLAQVRRQHTQLCQERDQAKAASAALRSQQERLQRQLADLGGDLSGCQRELASVEAEVAADRAEAAAHRARLRCLEERRAAFQLACGSLPPALAPLPAEGEASPTNAPKPLLGLAAEAGELAERAKKALEEQLAEAAAKSAAADDERQNLERERGEWEEQLRVLRQERGPLLQRREDAASSFKKAQTDVEQLKTQRAVLLAQVESAERQRERYYQERNRMQANMGCQKRTVEDIRGMTWQQLAEAKDVMHQTSKTWQAADLEHQQRRRELAKLAVAHSKALAETSSLEQQPLRVKLPDPDSVHMEAALHRAQAASDRAARGGGAAGGASLEEAARGPRRPPSAGPGVAPALREASLPRGLTHQPAKAGDGPVRPASAGTGPAAAPIEAKHAELHERGLVQEQDGTFAWAPDLGPGCGPMARRPMSPRRAGAAPPPSFSRVPALPPSAAAAAAAAAPGRPASARGSLGSAARGRPGSARLRNDLIDTGHLVLASARG